MSFFDDYAIRRPTIDCQSGIDIIRFWSSWQVRLMLEPKFVRYIAEYVQVNEQFRLVLNLESMRGLSGYDFGNLKAVFMPLIMYGGIICLCGLHSEIDRNMRLEMEDSGFLIAVDLEAAIRAVKDAELEV